MKYLITLIVLVTLTLKVIFGVTNTVEVIKQQNKDLVAVSLTYNTTEGVF